MNDLETLIRQLIRVGVVSDIDEKGVTARVTFDDQDDVTSASLQVIVKNTDENADYWMPDVGEQVLCLFLPVGPQQGFILGSFYDEMHTPPANTVNKRVIKFRNGTRIENDRESNSLLVDAVGDVTVKATGTVTIDAPETIITGNTTVKGLLTYLGGLKGSSEGGTAADIQGEIKVTKGDVVVDGIGVKKHHHDAQGEHSPTTEAKA
ncbi:phage baseplate assembly protein V [Salmonella enterica]|nr:phage baseplate assembly protein V [Salmonella enterica]EED5542407.1 phage baseplate assembly protein V [Salmonella enterica subsp. enterica serovar Saintpaul]ECL6481782.1 phage baseplate assembly protein V [Salmonella enterica]EFS6522220.1 phage baseplate assembly protein V [Salmonella enterica]EJB3410263.1 phage baseplate assembly protein V [Salmonella enterica]